MLVVGALRHLIFSSIIIFLNLLFQVVSDKFLVEIHIIRTHVKITVTTKVK